MPVKGKASGRFELPQLTPVNFSLTDGTNIPPPPDSPIEEKPPAPVSRTDAAAPAKVANGQTTPPAGEARGRTHEQPPVSPASTTRPSSIRRFLSRKSLNANYRNGTNTNDSYEDLTGTGRPDSPGSLASSRPGLGKKKSGSWFRGLGRSGTRNRTSVVYENAPPVESRPKPKGPPPPKLPELNQLKAKIPDNDQGSLGGGDLFKNIK